MGYAPKIEIGTIFNYWTVTQYNSSKQKYLCKCICGNEGYVSSSTLKSNKSKSCGCREKESVGKRIIESGFKALKHKIYTNYVAAAKKRGYTFTITEDDFCQLIVQNCYYCGIEPYMTYKYGRGKNQALDYSEFKYNGVDRVDNEKDYTKDNCVPCCKFCNNAKSTYGKDWLLRVKRLFKFQVKQGTFNDYPERE